MKNRSKYLLLLSVVVLLAACTKEKKFERWLKKGVGEWEVTAYNVKYYQDDTLQSDEMFSFFGKYVFDENGTFFTINYNDSEQTIAGYENAGFWTNSKDMIYLDIKGAKVREMKILEMKKEKMKLEYEEENPGGERYVITISFEKAD